MKIVFISKLRLHESGDYRSLKADFDRSRLDLLLRKDKIEDGYVPVSFIAKLCKAMIELYVYMG
jgi:hypothetical protein